MVDGYFGFELVYRNGKIGRSRPLDHEPQGIDICGPNRVYVKCGNCGVYMKYSETDWICPMCGTKVRQMTPYHQIERENREWEKKFESDYDDFYG